MLSKLVKFLESYKNCILNTYCIWSWLDLEIVFFINRNFILLIGIQWYYKLKIVLL